MKMQHYSTDPVAAEILFANRGKVSRENTKNTRRLHTDTQDTKRRGNRQAPWLNLLDEARSARTAALTYVRDKRRTTPSPNRLVIKEGTQRPKGNLGQALMNSPEGRAAI